MKKVFFLLVLVCVLISPVILIAGGSQEGVSGKAIELKWYQPEAYGYPWTDIGQMICDEVWKQSDGRIKITQYVAGSLGSQSEAIDMLRTGSLDIATSGPVILHPYSDDVMIFGVPYLFRDIHHASKVMDAELDNFFNKEILEKSGVRTIALWYYGVRTLSLNSDKDIMRPEDLKGLKIRCMTVPVFKDAVNSLGADATPVEYTELYMALQTGVVQGQENPILAIASKKFHEVQNMIVLTNHMVHMGSVHASEKNWQNKLTEADRTLVMKIFDDHRSLISERIIKETEEMKKELEESGKVRFVEPDYEAFKAYSVAYMRERYPQWQDTIEKWQAIK